MNNFDKELNKILLEQNLIDENAFIDGLKSVGGKIVKGVKGALNWSIDKIKSFVEKIWKSSLVFFENTSFHDRHLFI